MKDDCVHILNYAKYILHEKPPKNVIDYANRIDEHIEKVLLLTTDLLEKCKIIEIMKKTLIKRMNNYL